ncbi:MAG: nucleoside triphosphate pyrophosphatase [Bacillota bacterium]
MEIILASKSKRRKSILKKLNLNFKVKGSNIKEKISKRLTPKENVMSIAFQKGIDVAKKNKDSLVIAADTIVVTKDDEILGKPNNESKALKVLKKLNNTYHYVYTGYCLINYSENKKIIEYQKTKVFFNNNDIFELKKYISKYNVLDKAGGYGIQEHGALLVENINGDYYNIVGLPINKINKQLKKYFKISMI